MQVYYSQKNKYKKKKKKEESDRVQTILIPVSISHSFTKIS